MKVLFTCFVILMIMFSSWINDAAAQLTPVSDRTPQVRDAIAAAAGVPANQVTEAHLAAIKRLDLRVKNITGLKAGDFDGLNNLLRLNLGYNQLSTLPSDIFDNLTKLVWLELTANQLSTLPSNIFDNLTKLIALNLGYNQLSTLPDDIFDNLTQLKELSLTDNQLSTLSSDIFDNLTQLGYLYLESNQLSTLSSNIFDNLTQLRYLYLESNQLSTLSSNIFDNLTQLKELSLSHNQLSTLSSDIFDNLTQLKELSLSHNQLSTLPSGIFAGLTELTSLRLHGNAVDPLPLPVSLEAVGNGTFKAVASTGAPFDIVLPLVVSNGSLTTGATTVTISTGQVESEVLTVNRTPGTSGAVSVNIGVLPGIPTDVDNYNQLNHQGYALVKSGTLPLVVISEIVDPPPPTNNPPVFTEGASATRSIAENTPANRNIGSPISATDPDAGDTLTYSLGGTDAGSFSIVSSSGQLQTKAALDYEKKNEYTVTVTVRDTTNASDTITVTINVTDVNEDPPASNRPPAFTEGASATRSIAENTPANRNIGSPISATDPDAGDTLTYSLGGTDAGSFSIVSSSGQLQTKAALDYEKKNEYTVTVTVRDTTNASDTITVTINVTDVNEQPPNRAPTFTEGASTTRTIAENTAAGTNIGSTVSATDADDDRLTYTLSGTDVAAFSIVSTTGQLRTLAALDYETKSIYTVSITASDGSLTDTITVTINVTDIDEAPVFTEGASTTRTIAENTAAGTNIGSTVSATDADDDRLTYTLSGTDVAAFSIVSTTGQLRTLAALDYETKSIYTVSITASDGSLTDTITVTINVTDIDEAPVFTEGASTTRTVAENTAAGTNIGSAVSATDPDGDILTYTLSGTDAAAFSIDSTTGQLRTLAALDYETKSIYTVAITASDGSLTDTITVTINVTDIDEAPVFTEGASTTRTVAENTAAGTNIGSAVSATDPDGDILTYTLSGTDAAAFSIDSTTGQLRTLAALDYETKSIYTVAITASDGSLTDTINVTINVTDIDEGPPNTITPVSDRTPQVRDAIVAATGVPANEVTEAHLAAITSLNLNLKNITSLKAGDFDGLNNLTVLELWGNQLSTLPLGIFDNLTQLTTLYLDSNQLSTLPSNIFAGLTELTTLWLNGNAVDPLPLPVSLEAVGNGAFKAVASTGAPFDIVLPLVVSNGSLTTDATTVTISTGQVESEVLIVNRTPGTSGDVSVDIGVIPGIPTNHQGYALAKSGTLPLVVISGIAEPPPSTNNPPVFTEGASTTRTVAENTAAGTNIGSAVSATDADGDILTYTLGGTDAAAFSIDSTTGQLRTQAALNAAIKSVYFVTVAVSDDKIGAVSGGVHTVTISVIINVTDAEMPPMLDVNSDDVVDIVDLLLVAASFGVTVDPTTPNPADVNDDGVVDLTDLLLVIGGMGSTGGVAVVAAPVLSEANLHYWIAEAKRHALGDVTFEKGIAVLEQLLGAVRPTPKETLLLSNYPNPFNPETWIPYQLAKDAEVTVTISDVSGVVVRELVLGHKPAGVYHSRARAAHWDGRNAFGEKVASGVYFYIFTAGDFTATRKMIIRK